MTWKELAQNVYYAGTGGVLLATAFRFFYDKLRKIEKRNEFLEKLEKKHIPALYRALHKLEREAGIHLDLPPYEPPSDKPLGQKQDSED